ncbi:MAG: Holliday junction branch migration protein RuvA [Candidatus Nanopelagicaceae bacterium]|nr:Holliday junction branch migration protein RuvA [Candidatus Nanopelagicaceae bacterium]
MISSLFGRVRSLQTDRVIVEVGGVGLSVNINVATSARLSVGNDAQFFTSLVVREDSLTLYGFLDDSARALFDLVQTVSGIGPKVALAILGVMTPEDLGSAIAREDVKAIERIPGIGHKGAQRLILELKGKISHPITGPHVGHVPVWREQLTSALISLGFSAKEADTAVAHLLVTIQLENEDPSSIDMGELLKRALQRGA